MSDPSETDEPDREEHRLVERARAGDASAFETLVRRYQELAFRTAYVVAGRGDEADDAAQEAFLKAHRALPRFRSGAPFRPWLLRIVANEARNRRRSAGRRERLAERAMTERPLPEAVPSPEAAVISEERRRTLLDAVNRLREEDQVTIASRYFLELSEAETAAALGCAVGTVKSRLSRALTKLRQELGDHDASRPAVEVRR